MEQIDIFLDRVERLLANANLKLTEKRKEILEILFKSEVPLSGVGIQAELARIHNTKVSIGSIYKLLNILSYYNILQVLILPPYKTRHYSVKSIKSQSYLVCNICGKISKFFDGHLEKQLREKLERKNFILMSHRIVLYGFCEDCK